MLQSFFSWFIDHYIELLGTIFGLLYIFFSIKQNIWCWPIGLISSVIYVSVFFNAKFYADMGLQLYYVFISIYGWYYWIYGGKSTSKNQLEVTTTGLKLGFLLFLVNLGLFLFISFVLVNFTDSEIPYWDAFTTAASIVATWMLAQKKIEHWILWIIVDTVSLGLYIYKELYATVILFAVYTVLAFFGYLEWKKSLQKT